MCQCNNQDGNCRCRACGLMKSLFILGAVVSGSWFLFKTKKGEEVRQKIKDFKETAEEKIDDAYEDLIKQVEELKEKVLAVKDNLQEKMEDVTADQKEELEDKLKKIRTESEELWTKIKAFSLDVKKAAKKRFASEQKKSQNLN